jgi:HEPN domain-containing protein
LERSPCDLIERGRIRHGLFLAHLAVEKTVKAHVCRVTGGLAPMIHNLVRLAEAAGLDITDEQRDLMAEVNEFNIEGRYPEMLMPVPTQAEANQYRARIGELLQCLNNLF